MSKAKTTEKVLRTALGRIQKGWKQGDWVPRSKDPNDSDYGYCLVGAICGTIPGVNPNLTTPQIEALMLVGESLEQLAQDREDLARHQKRAGMKLLSYIPSMNDDEHFTFEDAERAVKIALIKAETAQLMALEGMDDEEIDDLLEDLNSDKKTE